MGSKDSANNGGMSDPRFAAARSDPRFQRFPKRQKKVDIDQRFAGMFEDKAFQVKSAVDKRGRKLAKPKQKEDMRKYYHMHGEEEANLGEPAALQEVKPRKGKSVEDPKFGAKVSKRKADGADTAAVLRRPQPGKGAKAIRTSEPTPSTSESEESEAVGSESEGDRAAAERWARVRGLTGPESSSSSSEDESESDKPGEGVAIVSDEEDVDLAEWGVGAMAGNPDEQVPEVQEETSRLAVLDLDWSKVKAIDILAMLQSFLKKGQQIKRVTVFPSDYGLERMAGESRFGPQGLAVSKAEPEAIQPASRQAKANGKSRFTLSKVERAAVLEILNEQDSEDEQDVEAESAEEGSLVESEDSYVSDEDEAGASLGSSASEPDVEVARRRLQLYERSRLRYYYAIAECSSIAAARQLYTECDGMEFEHSASLFDLRYVPDTEDFSQRKVRETATAVPSGYRPPDVGIAAMLHTKPKLTWDAEDEGRKKMLHKRVSKDELRDDDFKAYLGSESDEDGLPEQKKLSNGARYRQLLTGSAADAAELVSEPPREDSNGSEEDARATKEKDRGMEMEVTFGGGLDDLTHRLKAKVEERLNKKNDTVWQAYLRKQGEKRRLAKARGRRQDDDEDDAPSGDDAAEQDPYFRHADNAFDDPFFNDASKGAETKGIDTDAKKGSKRAKLEDKREKQTAAHAEKQRQAQLELLLMDDKALQDAVRVGAKVAPEAEAGEQAGEEPKQRLSKKARIAAKKAARRAKRGAASDEEDLPTGKDGSKLQLDSSDSRFDALFTSPDFALDPTDPQFAASDGAKKIQKEAASRRAKAKAGTTQARPEKPVQAKLQPDAQGMPPDDKQAKQQGLSPSASHNS